MNARIVDILAKILLVKIINSTRIHNPVILHHSYLHTWAPSGLLIALGGLVATATSAITVTRNQAQSLFIQWSSYPSV